MLNRRPSRRNPVDSRESPRVFLFCKGGISTALLERSLEP